MMTGREDLRVPPRPQLITYPGSLGGDLQSLSGLLTGQLAGLFGGVHVLPPFPSSGDRGFSPLTHTEIDPEFGTWGDIEAIAREHMVMLDVVVNHISRKSPEFQDFCRHGKRSRFADLFITLDKVWPGGEPSPSDMAELTRRRPGPPFERVIVEDTGARELVWTTFGAEGRSEQIDLDVQSDLTRAMIEEWLEVMACHGVGMIRLDAVGYVVKRPGTSCFMVEPDVYEFLEWATSAARRHGLIALPEVHDRYETHQKLSERGFWTYDFVLPGLVLDALDTGSAQRLAAHLETSTNRQFTTLDCHDGIPLRPDLDGILGPDEMRRLTQSVVDNGGNVSRLFACGPGEVDSHQLNCTYYSALGRDEDRYLAARAIQLFAKGVPQIYYVGLLAGENDDEAVARTGEGRAINRHDYTMQEIDSALDTTVVGRLLELIRLRNTHPAFDGELHVERAGGKGLRLTWSGPDATCSLGVDVATGRITVDV
jgi:sucrose 6(F)-phosphate phosphorylase